MTDTYAYGERKRIINRLCTQRADWTSADLMRATGWTYTEVRSACRQIGVKPPSVLRVVPIDKDIPIPSISRGEGKAYSYPWRQMKIGDSFLSPTRIGYASAHGNARETGQRLGKKFTIRTTPEGLRCWRIA